MTVSSQEFVSPIASSVYEQSIATAPTTGRAREVQFDVEEALDSGRLTDTQATALMEKARTKIAELAKGEFNSAAKALCPGGPDACKLGINVSQESPECALLKTCRTRCAQRVQTILETDPTQLGEVELRKRVEVERLKRLAGVTQTKVDCFEK